MRVPHSLVAGYILSKCSDGRRCPLTLKEWWDTFCTSLKCPCGVCAHPSTVGLNGLPLMNTSSSIVLSLPKVMKDFVQTRDGQGHVVVRTESLKRQFKNLYYESPVPPTQVFSNSFILQMTGERMKYSSSLRDCELWGRKERSKRTNLLLVPKFGILFLTRLKYLNVRPFVKE